MFGSMGITELVLILFIVLIIFGAGKLPQLGEGLGKAIKGFKKSVHEADAIELEASKQEAQIPAGGPATVDQTVAQQAAQPSPTAGTAPQAQAPVSPEPPKV